MNRLPPKHNGDQTEPARHLGSRNTGTAFCTRQSLGNSRQRRPAWAVQRQRDCSCL